jgi:hypothetical protein
MQVQVQVQVQVHSNGESGYDRRIRCWVNSTLGYRVLYGYDEENNAFNGSFRLQQWMYGPFAALKYSF